MSRDLDSINGLHTSNESGNDVKDYHRKDKVNNEPVRPMFDIAKKSPPSTVGTQPTHGHVTDKATTIVTVLILILIFLVIGFVSYLYWYTR